MLKNEGDRLLRVVVCTPKSEYFRVSNRRAHNIRQLADQEKAKQQHDTLKSILKEFGCEVIDIPELSGHPNSVFTRDTALCTPNGYIKLRMGLSTRKGEEDWMSQVLESLGVPNVGNIKEPGTVEGGDIILAGSVAFVGRSSRTNNEGVKQISSLLSAMNYEIRSISVPKPYLHLGGAMSVIGPKRILYCHRIFPNDFFKGFDKIEISYHEFVSGNVICLGDNEIVADAANIEVIEKLEGKGLIVHAVDLSEFVKGKGGPSCLILPIERKKE
ncbi:MAG: dimethylarginine dimethylaminohydrolase family protein [Candidatus Aminicenantia bacterium]